MFQVLIPFLMFLSFSSHPASTVHALHLKMIHRDSIHSPLYPGNITKTEMIYRLSNYTQARLQSFEATGYSEDHIRPRVRPGSWLGNSYLVELTIGTPDRRTYFLSMDTGSDLTWLQCQPCINCWNQFTPIFDPRMPGGSNTFLPISCNDFMCDHHRWRCFNNQCIYALQYTSGQTSKGVVARETFGFSSVSGYKEYVPNLVFGCGRENRGFDAIQVPNLNGVLGLNMRDASLANQIPEHRFSYCLPPVINQGQPPSLLRFGTDAILRGPRVRTIHFVGTPTPKPTQYYLGLVDVSIANHRIGFPPGAFAIHSDGRSMTGGLMIDSGCAATSFMAGMPYTRVRDQFREYFNRFRLPEARMGAFELCYIDQGGRFRAFPSMTLHFDNGNDLVVQPENVVVKGSGGRFCVAIKESRSKSYFGAYQQHNYRFSYDIASKVLSYVPADCTRDH